MNNSKVENKDVVLAIDFGTVRIGLAISRYTLAEPLEIIPNDELRFSKIKEICFEHDYITPHTVDQKITHIIRIQDIKTNQIT